MGAAYEENESIWRRQVLTVLRDIRDAVSPKGETPSPEPEPEKPEEWSIAISPTGVILGPKEWVIGSRYVRVHDVEACERLMKATSDKAKTFDVISDLAKKFDPFKTKP